MPLLSKEAMESLDKIISDGAKLILSLPNAGTKNAIAIQDAGLRPAEMYKYEECAKLYIR